MEEQTHFSMMAYTELTQKVCMYTVTSIVVLLFFLYSPLRRFFLTSYLTKIVAICILAYTIYLNYHQILMLQLASITQMDMTASVSSQLNKNILCGYVFMGCLAILFLLVLWK